MIRTPAALQAAAAEFLATSAPVAWEPSAQQRASSLLTQFSAGAINADALRAALATERAPLGHKAGAVAMLSLAGVLTPSVSLFSTLGIGTSLRSFVRELHEAVANESIRSIVVWVDSPGGRTGMVPEAAAALRHARDRKPVLATVAGLNASAAYWITANATTITATPSAHVGSIGVYTIRPSIARQLARDGVDVEIFSAGRFKGEGDISQPVSDAERANLKARVDEAYGEFVNDVAAGRRVAASTVRAGYGEGRAVSAREAKRLGMIDDVAVVDVAIARFTSRSGQHRANDSRAELDLRQWRLRLGMPQPASTNNSRAEVELREWEMRLR